MVKKRFVVFGLALLLVGLLVALDIALAARTVDQLARSEVHAGMSPASMNYIYPSRSVERY